MRRAALLAVVVVVGFCAGLPWLLGLPVAQRRLAAQASAILAPGSLDFAALRLSWFRPTEVSNLTLRDAQGDPVLVAPRAVFEWNLAQILVHRPTSAMLKIERGELDIERFADGKVDLYETLKPVLGEHPKWRLFIRIENGRLRLRDPALAEPLLADRADIDLDLSRGSEPISWNIALVHSRSAGPAGRLSIDGSMSRAEADTAGNHDVTVSVKGSRWPCLIATSGIRARGDFDGNLKAQRRSGWWELSGDATIQGLEATGGLLAPDAIRLDSMRAVWKLLGRDQFWNVEELALKSPLGELRATGLMPPSAKGGTLFEASVDLAALSRQLPRTLRLRDDVRVERGLAHFRLDLRKDPSGSGDQWSARGNVSDLVATQGQKNVTIREPAAIEASLKSQDSTFTLERFQVKTPFLNAAGQGNVDEGINVSATLDLAAFRERFGDWIDLRPVDPAGHCKLDAHYRRTGKEFLTKLNAVLRDVRVSGLPLLGTFQHDDPIRMDLETSGAADAAGWPRDWRKWSVRAYSGPSVFEVQAPADSSPWTGKLTSTIDAQCDRDLWNLGLRLELRDLTERAGTGALERPAMPGDIVLDARGSYAPGDARLEVVQAALRAPYIRADCAGAVRGLSSGGQVDLQGSLFPDWDALSKLLATKVEPNARISGQPRAWRLTGTIPGLASRESHGALRGEFGIQLDELDVFGMRLRASALVVRSDGDRVLIDPIDSALNGGALHLEPELIRDKDGSLWLRLGPRSTLDGAVVNDEVSHRVLSFAAPVLDGATRVQGQISLKLREAVFPILAGPGAEQSIQGDMLFDHVRFMPGRLAEELLGVFRKEETPLLVLRDPISIRIAGRKVYQKGLAIHLGKAASLGLEGSVDFDKNLDMVASLGMVPGGAEGALLAPIVKSARLEIPIRGTLGNPKIDRNALKERLKSIGSDLLETSMKAGARTLSQFLHGLPSLPLPGLMPPRRAAPPPPMGPEPSATKDSAPRAWPQTASERRRLREERRQQRLEKKAERRLKREQPPDSDAREGVFDQS